MKCKTSLAFIVLVFITILSPAQATSLEEFNAKLVEHQGKVIYVDFWASWCVPCRRSFPWMNEMTKRHEPEQFKVITINLDVDYADAQAFLTQYPANFDVVYDPEGLIAKQYQLKGMPSSFIIDQSGKVVSAHVGFTDKKRQLFEQEINQLLTSKTTD